MNVEVDELRDTPTARREVKFSTKINRVVIELQEYTDDEDKSLKHVVLSV